MSEGLDGVLLEDPILVDSFADEGIVTTFFHYAENNGKKIEVNAEAIGYTEGTITLIYHPDEFSRDPVAYIENQVIQHKRLYDLLYSRLVDDRLEHNALLDENSSTRRTSEFTDSRTIKFKTLLGTLLDQLYCLITEGKGLRPALKPLVVLERDTSQRYRNLNEAMELGRDFLSGMLKNYEDHLPENSKAKLITCIDRASKICHMYAQLSLTAQRIANQTDVFIDQTLGKYEK